MLVMINLLQSIARTHLTKVGSTFCFSNIWNTWKKHSQMLSQCLRKFPRDIVYCPARLNCEYNFMQNRFGRPSRDSWLKKLKKFICWLKCSGLFPSTFSHTCLSISFSIVLNRNNVRLIGLKLLDLAYVAHPGLGINSTFIFLQAWYVAQCKTSSL